jgi:TPR repeat protein
VIPALLAAVLASAPGPSAPVERAGPAVQRPRVAVLDVELAADGAGAEQAALTALLAKALADPEAWQVITVRDLAALLGTEKRRQLLGCSADACLAELASDLGSEGAVITTVGQVGGQLVAAGRVTGSRGGNTLARATVQVVGSDLAGALQSLGAALRLAYRKARGLPAGGEAGEARAATGGDCLAVADCEIECRAGGSAACARLGNLVGADEARPMRAAAVHGRACDLGDLDSCLIAARTLQAHAFHREAYPLLQRACGAEGTGGAEACLRAGRLLLAGRQVGPDLDQGLALFRLACDRGEGAACLELGQALDSGPARGRDETAAGLALDQACRLGQAGGCLVLADRAEAGRGMARDAVRAATLRQTGCGLGSAVACGAVARALLEAGQPGRALETWLAVCHGSTREGPAACADAAAVLLEGPSQTADLAQGRATARLACTKGDETGCLLAAQGEALQQHPDWVEFRRLLVKGCPGRGAACGRFMARRVMGWPEPFGAFALPSLDAACADGAFEACRAAALVLGQGRGMARDSNRARSFEERSCRAGGGEDCHAWGLRLENRINQEEERFKVYGMGCRARSGPCCARLAELTYELEGVSRRSDRVLALRQQACQYGVKASCD